MSVVTGVAGPEHTDGLAALFSRADVACHCRYFHFSGNTNAWLDRCAHHVDENQAGLRAGLEARTDDALGVVALDGSVVVGWMKVAPALSLPKLYGQRLYARLPCFDGPRERVMTIGCVLVDPARRHEGVARALLGAAIELARSRGASALEAFPRRAEGLRDAEAWTGPASIFDAAGFAVVNDFAPYPVLRLSLDP